MTNDGPGSSPAWQRWRREVDVDSYDARWRELEEAGVNPHGEADLVMTFAPRSVLDGGCGTGRVAIELARRGVEVVGVDLDPDMIAVARSKAPDLEWHVASLATVELGRTFDVVVLAGNVIPFVAPEARPDVVSTCARHLAPGGRLLSGFSLRAGWPTIAEMDGWCADAGLALAARWPTWDGAAGGTAGPGDDYAVSVHAPAPADAGTGTAAGMAAEAGTAGGAAG